jgi:hypothetical protein
MSQAKVIDQADGVKLIRDQQGGLSLYGGRDRVNEAFGRSAGAWLPGTGEKTRAGITGNFRPVDQVADEVGASQQQVVQAALGRSSGQSSTLATPASGTTLALLTGIAFLVFAVIGAIGGD